MGLFRALLKPLEIWNDLVLPAGRHLAVAALAAMVCVTLLQVFMRYALNAALPWPDEAARFLMLWMTGLVAPLAYRQGAFVAIDFLGRLLPRTASALLSLALLAVSLVVLLVAIQLGWRHVASGWLFSSSSLRLPLALVGGETIRIKLAWMYLSLLCGLVLLTAVNLELLLRTVIVLAGGRVRPLPRAAVAEAE